MEKVYLLLGGNLGNREEVIRKAIELIHDNLGSVQNASSFYETEPWGMENVQNFLNIALELSTELDSNALLDGLLLIEKQLGRSRNSLVTEYESRPVDIDILFYGSTVIQSPRLIVPHPRMHLRKFVLIPLCEIASGFLHPVFQKSVLTLLKECQDNLGTVMLKPYIL